MKKWLKNPGGADEFPGLNIKWTPGHNPELKITKGKYKDTSILLEQHPDADKLNALMKKYGFRKRSVGEVTKESTKPSFRQDSKKVGEVEADPESPSRMPKVSEM